MKWGFDHGLLCSYVLCILPQVLGWYLTKCLSWWRQNYLQNKYSQNISINLIHKSLCGIKPVAIGWIQVVNVMLPQIGGLESHWIDHWHVLSSVSYHFFKAVIHFKVSTAYSHIINMNFLHEVFYPLYSFRFLLPTNWKVLWKSSGPLLGF